jgi:hypothetical protein
MSTSINDILFVMKTVEERGLTGVEKRKLALDMLVASGLVLPDEREMAGAAIDAIAYAAKNERELRAFVKRRFKFCC